MLQPKKALKMTHAKCKVIPLSFCRPKNTSKIRRCRRPNRRVSSLYSILFAQNGPSLPPLAPPQLYREQIIPYIEKNDKERGRWPLQLWQLRGLGGKGVGANCIQEAISASFLVQYPFLQRGHANQRETNAVYNDK
jgi:hypothetical protein